MTEPLHLNKQYKRFPELDALRGIAVLGVVLYHYTVAYDIHFKINDPGKFHFIYGFLSVELFFIISGFVIFLTLENSKKKVDFLVSRFSRLYPAYWASIFLTIFIVLFFPVPTLGHYKLLEVLANITMFQGFNKHIRLIDQVYWTLKFELTFYILMYILYLLNLLKHIRLICFPWLALSLLSVLFNIPGKKYFDVLFILEFAPLFIAGINFYKLKLNNKDFISHLLIILSLLSEIPWVYHYDVNTASYGLSIAILIIFYGVFYFFVLRGLSFLNNRILLFFGTISYSLYLLHNVIGYTVIFRLRAIWNYQLVYVPAAAAVVIALSVFVSYVIEKPAMKVIRKWYKNRKQPVQQNNLGFSK